jgi:hypothetical protein
MSSRSYIHYGRLPVTHKDSGYASKKGAGIVSNMLVKMIKEDDLAPKLNKMIIDSLELKMKMKESDR